MLTNAIMKHTSAMKMLNVRIRKDPTIVPAILDIQEMASAAQVIIYTIVDYLVCSCNFI